MAIQDRRRYRRGRLLADELSQGEMESRGWERGTYCSSTIWPLAYSKRFSFDRNDRPSRFSDSAESGSTMASTSRTTRPPTSITGIRARAALMVPLAVLTLEL